MAERIDRTGEFKTALKKNRKIIYATQDICGICGLPVNKDLKAPDPMSKTIDHIIPIAKGGHPSDLENLQLAHRWCNLKKRDGLFIPGFPKDPGTKNSPGIKNTRPQKTPTPEKDLPLKNTPGTPFTGDKSASAGLYERGAVDNDDLPQHADWSTLCW